MLWEGAQGDACKGNQLAAGGQRPEAATSQRLPCLLQVWSLLQFYSQKLHPEFDMRSRFGNAFGFRISDARAAMPMGARRRAAAALANEPLAEP